jgi:hypothetical protein
MKRRDGVLTCAMACLDQAPPNFDPIYLSFPGFGCDPPEAGFNGANFAHFCTSQETTGMKLFLDKLKI